MTQFDDLEAGDSIDVYEGDWGNEWIVVDPEPDEDYRILAHPYGFEDRDYWERIGPARWERWEG